jgi:integrase
MPKITKRVVDGLKPRRDGDLFEWDSELRGFGVRLKPSGVRSYVVQYRNNNNRSRRFTLKNSSALTPDEARAEARNLLAAISKGHDPAEDKRALRKQITVRELCGVYLLEEKGRIKESTLTADKSRIDRHVLPLLGSRTVVSLTARDIEQFVKDIERGKTAEKLPKPTLENPKPCRKRGGLAKGGKGIAARTVGMLGTILQRAVRDGVISSNPARGVKREPDKVAKPPFSWELVAKLGKGLDAAATAGEPEHAVAAIRFLLLSGCRRMEALTLKWEYVDQNARCIRFPDTKSGAQTRPMSRAALNVLKSMRDGQNAAYVFPGDGKHGHFVGLPKVFDRVLNRAELKNLSIHGLRHWFASAAADMNFSELTIAGLLGHRVKGITARYASAPDSALLAAADRVSTRLAGVLENGVNQAENVVDITQRIPA